MKKSKILDKVLGKKPTVSEIFLEKTKLRYLDKKGCNEWPIQWRKIHFKLYPRFKQILLPKNFNKVNNRFLNLFIRRRSQREFLKKPISRKELSALLLCSAGITESSGDWDKTKRAYPSAGARYPLELYPVIFLGKDVNPGIYHYNVKQHSLELILEGDYKKELLKSTSQDWIENAAVVILISAVFGRTVVKYKERGYRYFFIEAGHLGQNISLVGETLNLDTCAIGGFIDDEINELVDIDGQKESVIYILALGYPK